MAYADWLQASFDGRDSDWIEMTAYRHYTEADHYIVVSSSTQEPEVPCKRPHVSVLVSVFMSVHCIHVMCTCVLT